MPKYNLMDSQQPEFFDDNFEPKESKPDKTEIEKKPPEKPDIKPLEIVTDSDFSQKLFSDTEISKLGTKKPDPAQVPVTPEIPTIIKTSPLQDTIPKITPTIAERGPKKKEPDESRLSSSADWSQVSSLDDLAQPRPKFKFFIIGVIVVVVAVALYFIIPKIFTGGKEKIVTPVETPEEKLKREIRIRKDNFLNAINTDAHNRLGYLVQLVNVKPAKVRYSSLFLYGQNLVLEVFTSNRNDLADFNIKLKNNPIFANIKLESVDKRPGTRGGLFALYDIKADNRIPTGVSAERISRSPQEWITEFSQKNSLTVSTQRQISTRQEELFTVTRIEYKLKGTEQNCQALISWLADSNTNIGIHKLTMLPTNQRDMTKSPYQIHLILDFYM